MIKTLAILWWLCHTITLSHVYLLLTGDLSDVCDFSWAVWPAVNRIIFGRNMWASSPVVYVPPVEGEGGTDILPQVANIETMAITLEPNYMQLSGWIWLGLTGQPGKASQELMGNKQMRAVRVPSGPQPSQGLSYNGQWDLSGTSVVGSSPVREHSQTSPDSPWPGPATGQIVPYKIWSNSRYTICSNIQAMSF